MKIHERRILENLATTAALEIWLRCARAELASDPGNLPLSEFVLLVARQIVEKRVISGSM